MKFIKFVFVAIALANGSTSFASEATPEQVLAAAACPADETSKSIQKQISDLKSVPSVSVGSPLSQETLAAIKLDSDNRIYLNNLLNACATKEKLAAQERVQIAGFGWDPGLALSSISGASTEAQIVNGVIRVTKEKSESISLMFETHYLARMNKFAASIDSDVGIGPFVAIRAIDTANTQNNNFGAYGVGLMIGFARKGKSTGTYNLGFGYFADTQVKVLGSGMVEGQALPGTETAIRYKEVGKSGWMIMLSGTPF